MKKLTYLRFCLVAIIGFFSFGHYCQASKSTFPNRFFVKTDQTNVDGTRLGVHPGDTVYIESGHRDYLRFVNIHGDSLNYVIITNYAGTVEVSNETFLYGIQIFDCSFFRFSGSGDKNTKYGIKISKTAAKSNGLSLDGSSTNFEIDHLDITQTGFAGICANPKPDCEDKLNRGNFVQRNTIYHDNYIHSTWGEAFYIGHSFYTGYTISCDGVDKFVLPHELKGVRIYNNVIDSCGYDGIQLGCATEDCEIFGNKISYYGAQNEKNQNFGIIIAAGTTGKCYNNFIRNGTGNGINVFGLGNNSFYNNIIINPGYDFSGKYVTTNSIGIFCDDRGTIAGRYFNFFNNTIISPKGDGIRFISTVTKNNKVCNNLILNPGSFGTYYNNENDKSYVYYDNTVDLSVSNNYFSNNTQSVKNLNSAEDVYNYCLQLPVFNSGIDVSEYGIHTDFNGKNRKYNNLTDIGAFEYDTIMIPSQKSNSIKVFSNNSQHELIVYSTKKESIEKISIYQINGQKLYSQIPDNKDISVVSTKDIINRGFYFVYVSTLTEESLNKICINF